MLIIVSKIIHYSIIFFKFLFESEEYCLFFNEILLFHTSLRSYFYSSFLLYVVSSSGRQVKPKSSAIAEEPRDASCQLKSCQLPRNSAETTFTTSPEEIEVTKLEGYSGPMCNKHVHSTMTRSSCFHCLIGVKNKPTTDVLMFMSIWSLRWHFKNKSVFILIVISIPPLIPSFQA